MTDAGDLDALRGYAAQIAAAKRRVSDLEDERNALLVAVIGKHPSYGLISAAARAANLSRQRVNGILQLARARREGQNDPKS